ncbi:homocysteine S-methyltransferase family protein [bacterium]|nr:homocysteine S-methyltransferase family protein [bacterium]
MKKSSRLFDILKQRVVILDGAMGTMLQPHLASGSCMDMANILQPEVVTHVHVQYRDAGTDIISTNTFGASRIKLDAFGFGPRAKDVNIAGADLARKVAGSALVAGVMGPSGKLIEPLGELSFDEAFDAFYEQAKALAQGGVDLFLLETFADLKEIKIAVMAAKEAGPGLPLLASMTYEEGFKTFTGTDPETAATVLTSLGVDAVGVNCSTGPEPMLEVVGRYAVSTNKPIFVEANAGIPILNKGKTTYTVSADEMAQFGEKFVEIGASIVGSCCGSTPEYTKKIAAAVKNKKSVFRPVIHGLRLCSRTNTVHIGTGEPFAVIGERINPTNRDELAESIRQGKVGIIQQEAKLQVKQGAHLIDVNLGVPGIDEAAAMSITIPAIENVAPVPLVIDTSNPEAVEAALLHCSGKPLINSVNGGEESLNAVLPLAKKFGAAVLCLAVDEKGIPKTAEERISVLKKIIARADSLGIDRNDLICDTLTLTVSAQQKRAEQTLFAMMMVKNELGLQNVLGVSNISFGLPQRSLINSTFLAMAMAYGLDAAIMNPGDERMMQTVSAASVLTVRDRDSKNFIAGFKAKKSKGTKKPKQNTENNDNLIFRAILDGNRDEIMPLVEQALEKGTDPLAINNEILIPAIKEVGDMYDRKDIYLPQMILSAETMQRAFKVLEPHFGKEKSEIKGRVVITTVSGDVHDIGKNIVALFLKNHGFEVIDLGKNVQAADIAYAAIKNNADIVGLSALMTTTMVEMPKVIKTLRDAGSKARVVVGGAVVTKRYAREIGADGYAKDGVGAVKEIEKLVSS